MQEMNCPYLYRQQIHLIYTVVVVVVLLQYTTMAVKKQTRLSFSFLIQVFLSFYQTID